MAIGSQRGTPELEEIAFARRDRLPFEIEVLRLEELLRRPLRQDLTKPQRIHFYQLILVEEGDSSHAVDFEPYPTGRGHLLIVPDRHVQAFSPERKLRGYIVIFTRDFLDRCGQDMSQLENACHHLIRAGPHIQLDDESFLRVKQTFRALAEYTGAQLERFADMTVAAAFSLLVFTLAGLPETAVSAAAHEPRDELVASFLRHLEDHFTSDHHASFYADALHVSLRTLDRHLIAARSQTTRQAISARLVLEAKRLLTRREILIKNIAYQLGFSEPQNFTRFFRTQTGTSPDAFRLGLDH